MGSSGGGNSAGGGGATASPWLQYIHQEWLFHPTKPIDKTMTECLNDALASNPLTGLSAYDPDTALAAITSAVSDLKTAVDAMSWHTDFDAVFVAAADIIDTVVSPAAHISEVVTQHTTDLMNEYNNKLLPAFNAGMRDIGGILTSAFVIGRANILSDITDKTSRFQSELTLQAENKRADMITQATSEMLRLFVQKIEFIRTWSALVSDLHRLQIAAKSDQATEDKVIDVSEAKWPLELWQYGGNLLAAVSGGTVAPNKVDGNQMARIIGGGLSGASAGALIGSRIGGESGGGYGAILGGIAGLLAGSAG